MGEHASLLSVNQYWSHKTLNPIRAIYEWLPTTLHCQTFVADGICSTIGAINFDNRSLVLNDEATLMILGEQMNQIFFEDLADAEESTLEKFRHRPWFDRVDESAAMLLARVL